MTSHRAFDLQILRSQTDSPQMLAKFTPDSSEGELYCNLNLSKSQPDSSEINFLSKTASTSDGSNACEVLSQDIYFSSSPTSAIRNRESCSVFQRDESLDSSDMIIRTLTKQKSQFAEREVYEQTATSDYEKCYERAEDFLNEHNFQYVNPGEEHKPKKKFVRVLTKQHSLDSEQLDPTSCPSLGRVNASSLLLRRKGSFDQSNMLQSAPVLRPQSLCNISNTLAFEMKPSECSLQDLNEESTTISQSQEGNKNSDESLAEDEKGRFSPPSRKETPLKIQTKRLMPIIARILEENSPVASPIIAKI